MHNRLKNSITLEPVSSKSLKSLQEELQRKSSVFLEKKEIIVPPDVAHNRSKITFRQEVVDFFEKNNLFLAAIETISANAEDDAYNNEKPIQNSKYSKEYKITFSEKESGMITLKEGQNSEKSFKLESGSENFVSMGLHHFKIFLEIKKVTANNKDLVPLKSITTSIKNGGSLIGKICDKKFPCVTAQVVNQNRFIFQCTDIPDLYIKEKADRIFCTKNMILVSATGTSKNEVGIPTLVVRNTQEFLASNSVVIIELKPQYQERAYLSRLVKFMLSEDYRRQLDPQQHEKSLSLSVKNLSATMVPDPAKSEEDKDPLDRIENIEQAAILYQKSKREYERLLQQHFPLSNENE